MLSPTKIRSRPKNLGLRFIESIESTWKGHEQFALWLIERLHPRTVVDLGVDRGLSTIAFAYKNRGDVFGIDWFEDGMYAEKSIALDSAFCNISTAIRFNYVKNIHLIIGPFRDVSKDWHRKIDLLHIDWAHTYKGVKVHFDNWTPYLEENGVVLLHDVVSYPDEVGRFFDEIKGPKFLFTHASGLGVICKDEKLIQEVAAWQKKQAGETHKFSAEGKQRR